MSTYNPKLLRRISFEKAKGKKQGEIAKALDINKNTVTRYSFRLRKMNETQITGLLLEVLDDARE